MFEIEGVYTTEIVNFSNHGVFVCLFVWELVYQHTIWMAGKEMKVLQGKVNKH